MADKYLFSEWLQHEMNNRDLSQADLARLAGVTRSAINGILTGTRGPGIELCTALAVAFHLPPENVFRVAGLLPPVQSSDDRADILAHRIALLPEEDQAVVDALIETLLNKRGSRSEKSTSKPATTAP